MGCNSSKQEGYESQDQGATANPDDPKKSAVLREEAIKVAEEMMALTKGKRFHESYTRLTLTSYGASCKVLTAYHRTTNKKVAVKTIPKSRKQLERQRQKVMLEVGTFRMVEDHPNAVRVLEIFEGAECYYIVMECCEGGELFDHISKQGCFTERQAAALLRSLMLFLAHMHSKGIAHLDIKPENIMFDSEGASGVLKVLDFGSSVFVQPSELVRNAFGTVRYASPEMANDVCGQKADIWSAGVVMYILLCGRAPFLKSNDMETLNYIKNGPRVKFNGERWTAISQVAKDCIRALLEPNPRVRPTAVDVLAMPWLKTQVPETVIVPDTLKHLRTFANQSRIRRLLLGLMADQLVGSGANQLLGQFYSLDKDFSGTVEVSELVKAAKEAIPELSEIEINRMFEALDVDRTGTVDVKEFFAGLIQTIDEEKQTLVAQKSFTMLDKRGSGYVTKEAFMEVLIERAQAGTLKTMGNKEKGDGGGFRLHGRQSGGADCADSQVILDPGLVQELESEFANLDANGDGVLSFEEFKAILGIQSTPEGLTLRQPQLAGVPSIQEGMETLAQTLRTRTRSLTKDEQRIQLSRVSMGGGTAASTAGGAAGGGASGAPGGGAAAGAGAAGAASSTSALSGGTQPLSVDRAQLDLELPYDLETRDLLQILAPAKRTASQAPGAHPQQASARSHSVAGVYPSTQQVAVVGAGRGCGSFAGAPGGNGGGGLGAVGAAFTASEPAATAAAAASPPPAPVMTSVNSMRISRNPSSNASAPALYDKMPSMRAPSLPPLRPHAGYEFDGITGVANDLGSPVLPAGPGATRPAAAAAAAAAAAPAASSPVLELPSQVRWQDPPSPLPPLRAESALKLSAAGSVAEAAMAAAVSEPERSPRSTALQPPTGSPPSTVSTAWQSYGLSKAGGGGGGGGGGCDDTPLLGGQARSAAAVGSS